MALDHDLNRTDSYEQMMGISQAAYKGSQSESPDKTATFDERFSAVSNQPVSDRSQRALQSGIDLKTMGPNRKY
jgi:hypothetical protein